MNKWPQTAYTVPYKFGQYRKKRRLKRIQSEDAMGKYYFINKNIKNVKEENIKKVWHYLKWPAWRWCSTFSSSSVKAVTIRIQVNIPLCTSPLAILKGYIQDDEAKVRNILTQTIVDQPLSITRIHENLFKVVKVKWPFDLWPIETYIPLHQKSCRKTPDEKHVKMSK